VNRRLSFESATDYLKHSNSSATTSYNPVPEADLLQSVFQSKFTGDKFTGDNGVSRLHPNIPEVGKMSQFVPSLLLFKQVIDKMRTGAKEGPDAIPPSSIKSAVTMQLCHALPFLHQLSFRQGPS
jgi:hypothetical protein